MFGDRSNNKLAMLHLVILGLKGVQILNSLMATCCLPFLILIVNSYFYKVNHQKNLRGRWRGKEKERVNKKKKLQLR